MKINRYFQPQKFQTNSWNLLKLLKLVKFTKVVKFLNSVGTRCLLQISYVSCRNSPLSLHYHSALLPRKALWCLPVVTYFTVEIPHHNYALSPFFVILYDLIYFPIETVLSSSSASSLCAYIC